MLPRRLAASLVAGMGALLALVVAAGGPLAIVSRAEVRPLADRGVAEVLQQIERLQTTASALHTGAHPDDEDTAFMARVARGDHARVAYLTLNRGEGGQNAIGTDLFEALGVIRTEELLQARALDGGEQFFTRAYDFGFSKRADEAAQRWGEEQVLADMVRLIRSYRPLVVYSGFSGTPADGHGQHQLAGKLTPLAVRAAADSTRFPEQIAAGLRPWQAKKLYVRQGFRADPANPPTLRLETGRFDPVLGRSYFEIAMEGRSQHKSQEMGVPALRGPHASAMRLLESVAATPPEEASVFDGLDITIPAIARLSGLPVGAVAAELESIDRHVTGALREFDARNPARVVPALADGLRAVRAARRAVTAAGGTNDARAEADFLLGIKERQFEQAIALAAGVVVDPLSDVETVAPGESFSVAVRFFLADASIVTVSRVELQAPEGWAVAAGSPQESASSNPLMRFFREVPDRADHFDVTVPVGAGYTQPYWLIGPRNGDLFKWPAGAERGLPFDPPLLTARVEAVISGVPIEVTRAVEYRLVDPVRGELRRRLDVVPPISVALGSHLEIVPLASRGQPRRVVVRLQHGARQETGGTLRLVAPDGWTVEPAEAPYTLRRQGDRTSLAFSVTPAQDAPPGQYRVRAEAASGGRRFDIAMRTIAYPHIRTHRLYAPAEAQVRVLDLQVAPVRVGYIMGSGDQVPDAIRRLGLVVALLDESELASGDMSQFDVIVVGIRASEARPDFVANHGRLMSYVRDGGTLIVQYQQADYASRGLLPFPAEMATRPADGGFSQTSRVTDEEAPVRLLLPGHPAFTTPNRITADDWGGWVQERSLYALTTFDERYAPMLESADPGEPPQTGGQVIARVGKGVYIYTAYAWFRQLPAGVPGAYRLFANLLSLPRTLGRAPTAAGDQRQP